MNTNNLFILFVLIVFTYRLVYSGFDCQKCDRDNALIISAQNIINGSDIKVSQMNLPLTTGINKYFALPFVYLFGNVQHLTFLFWLIIIMKSFWSKHFFLFAAFFICSWIFYWNILHRQDEFYYPLAVLYLTRNWYIFILYFILNRNWFVIPVETTIHFKNIWLGYCLYVPLIINYLILKSDNFEYYKLKV